MDTATVANFFLELIQKKKSEKKTLSIKAERLYRQTRAMTTLSAQMLYWKTEYESTKAMFDALSLTTPKYLAISPMKYMKKAFGCHIEILLFRGFVSVEQRDENEWPLKITIKDALNFKMQLKSFFSILTNVEVKTKKHLIHRWNSILQFKLLSPNSLNILRVVTSKAIKNGCTLLHTSVFKSLITNAPMTKGFDAPIKNECTPLHKSVFKSLITHAPMTKGFDAPINYATVLVKSNTSTVQKDILAAQNAAALTEQNKKKLNYSQVLTATKCDLNFILN
jgi:hypothetical protein